MSRIYVNTLHIKPLATHKGDSNRHTSITSFDDMLKASKSDQEETTKPVKNTKKTKNSPENSVVSQSSSVKQKSEDTTTKKTSKSSSNKNSDQVTHMTGSGSTKKTTSASSMKKTKYDSIFKKAAERYNISESLLKAVAKAESNFNPNDVSSSGAMGIMQLMPDTVRGMGVKDPFDPEDNIMGGAKCLKQKLKEFNGNVKLALAAYNAGSGTVKRVGGIPSQCKGYINKILSYQKAFETAKHVT